MTRITPKECPAIRMDVIVLWFEEKYIWTLKEFDLKLLRLIACCPTDHLLSVEYLISLTYLFCLSIHFAELSGRARSYVLRPVHKY